MSESQSNIGNEEQSYQQMSQSNMLFDDPNAPIKSELHTIVDKLQLDEPPSEQKGRPLWQRVLLWAVPLWLIVFLVAWCFNARVDTCGGARVVYRGNILCIASERDFLLLNETYETEFLSRDTSEPLPIDSINGRRFNELRDAINRKYEDTLAEDYDLRARLTHLNALRGNGMDSTSYCRNLAIGYYNVAVNYLNKGNRDSACITYRFLKDWHWKDSVLTKGELAVLEQICATKAVALPPAPKNRDANTVQKPKMDKPKQVEKPRENYRNTPPQYKEPILPTSKVPDLNIGNLPNKRLETVENTARNAQTGVDNDPKSPQTQQRITPEQLSTKPCTNFDCAYKRAEDLLKQKAYQKALDNLDSAEGYLTNTNTKEKEQVKQLRRRLLVAIEKDKEDAKNKSKQK